MGGAALILPACPLLLILLRSFILLLPPGLDKHPHGEAQLGKGQKERLEEQQPRARDAKARAQATGKPGVEPYGVGLANSTPCLVVATARYSYIDSYIDDFIVENDMVGGDGNGCPYKLLWPSIIVCVRRGPWPRPCEIFCFPPFPHDSCGLW
jgi:hypothetical protein